MGVSMYCVLFIQPSDVFLTTHYLFILNINLFILIGG